MLFEEYAVLYPRAGRQKAGNEMMDHHPLGWSSVQHFKGKYEYSEQNREELWGRTLSEIDEAGAQTSVISSEYFWGATDEEIAWIRECLAGRDVSVVLYLRNAYRLSVSAYKQGLKQGKRVWSYEEAVKSHMAEWFNFGRILNSWRSVFAGDLQVLIYDKEKRALLESFLGLVSADLIEGAERMDRSSVNVSPCDTTIRLIRAVTRMERRAPKFLKPILHRTRRNLLGARVPGRYFTQVLGYLYPHPLVTEKHAELFKELVADWHPEFVAHNVREEDRKYFEF